MVPAVPPAVALIALTMKLAPERQGTKNNRIAHVKRASVAEWGKVGAANTICALLHRYAVSSKDREVLGDISRLFHHRLHSVVLIVSHT